MNHMYKAIDTTNHIMFENVQLPEVTKQVRKLIKLRHGNLIRTALIEEGVYHAYGYGRKKSNECIYYHFEITIERYIDIRR